MNSRISEWQAPRFCGWFLALALFLGAVPDSVHAARPLQPVSSVAVAAVVPADAWSIIQSALGNRRRMIQVLIILMLVGLFIMYRKAVE